MSTSEMRTFLDRSFALYDHDPQDGIVLENEWDVSVYRDDRNSKCFILFADKSISWL